MHTFFLRDPLFQHWFNIHSSNKNIVPLMRGAIQMHTSCKTWIERKKGKDILCNCSQVLTYPTWRNPISSHHLWSVCTPPRPLPNCNKHLPSVASRATQASSSFRTRADIYDEKKRIYEKRTKSLDSLSITKELGTLLLLKLTWQAL